MARLVFVCTVNRLRSVMAHYLFKDILAQKRALAQKIHVSSAGIVPEERIQKLEGEGIKIPDPLFGYRPLPCVLFHMAMRGLNVSEHRSMPLTSTTANEADLIITITRSHEDNVLAVYPHLKKKVAALEELSYPFKLPEIAHEPPGLMPRDEFCMRDCDHWQIAREVMLETEERLIRAVDEILIRLRT
jgi:protein-tyrosine-phosphatase